MDPGVVRVNCQLDIFRVVRVNCQFDIFCSCRGKFSVMNFPDGFGLWAYSG